MKIRKRYYLLSILLPVQWVLISVVSLKTEWIETQYSQKLYPVISKFLQYLLGRFPFSLGDLIYLLLIIAVISWMYRTIKSRKVKLKPALFKLGSIASIAYFFFYFNWGLNYFRKPLDQIIELEKTTYSNEELFQITEQLSIEANEFHLALTASDTLLVDVSQHYSKKDLRNYAREGYQTLEVLLPNTDLALSPVKASLFSEPLSYMGFAGYLNPWSNEAQINNRIPLNAFPATACHEIAHQLGFASESEANFIGYLAGFRSDHAIIRYSSSVMALRYCLFEVYKRDPDRYKTILEQLNKGIKKDFKQRQEFWASYQNWTEPFFKLFYDSYLKVNNQTHGIQSYNRMVGLLVNYRLQYDLN